MSSASWAASHMSIQWNNTCKMPSKYSESDVNFYGPSCHSGAHAFPAERWEDSGLWVVFLPFPLAAWWERPWCAYSHYFYWNFCLVLYRFAIFFFSVLFTSWHYLSFVLPKGFEQIYLLWGIVWNSVSVRVQKELKKAYRFCCCEKMLCHFLSIYWWKSMSFLLSGPRKVSGVTWSRRALGERLPLPVNQKPEAFPQRAASATSIPLCSVIVISRASCHFVILASVLLMCRTIQAVAIKINYGCWPSHPHV